MATQVTYYFNGSTAAVSDPNAVWTSIANITDSDNTTSGSCITSGTSATNYVTAGGTSAPSTGGPIGSVSARVKTGVQNVSTNSTTVIYTAALAETLGTYVSGALGSGGAYRPYFLLTSPAAGWSWASLQTLVFKTWTTNADVGLFIVEVLVTVNRNIISAYGNTVQVGNGMSRSEVAN